MSLCLVKGTNKVILHTFFKAGGQRYAFSLKSLEFDLNSGKVSHQESYDLEDEKHDLGVKSDF